MQYLVRGLAAPTAAGFAALARRGAVGHFCDDHIKAFEVLSIEAFDRLAAGLFARHVDLAPAPTLIDGDGGYRAEELEEHAKVVFCGVSGQIVNANFHIGSREK